MTHDKVVDKILDQKLQTKNDISLDRNTYIGFEIRKYLKKKLGSENKTLCLRYVLPIFPDLASDAEVQKIVQEGCLTFKVQFSESTIEDVLGDLITELMQEAVISAVNHIRDIGGEKVHELLGDLLDEADKKGIDRFFKETGVPREAIGWSGETRYITPEQDERLNDAIQIVDLLDGEVYRKAGVYMDVNTAKIHRLPKEEGNE
jgi:hypothetical protein